MQINFIKFFDNYHATFGATSLTVYNNINTMLQSLVKYQSRLTPGVIVEQWAYIAATCYHESNHTFGAYCEVRQYKTDTPRRKAVRAAQDKYWSTGYYGRGPVQLTWREEYAWAEKVTGRPLLNDPDLLLRDLPLGYEVAIKSMTDPSINGKQLSDYINTKKVDYVNARRVVNGTDRKQLIAGYAVKFYDIFKKAVF